MPYIFVKMMIECLHTPTELDLIKLFSIIHHINSQNRRLTHLKSCTIFISDHDSNGFLFGLLGRLQLMYDTSCLQDQGYQVSVQTFEQDSSDCQKINESFSKDDVIIFRGHGMATAYPFIYFLQKHIDQKFYAQNPSKKTIIFESCSTFNMLNDEIFAHQNLSLHVLNQCRIDNIFSAKYDIVASKLVFKNQKICSVEYIPLFQNLIPSILGRKMSSFTTPTFVPTTNILKSTDLKKVKIQNGKTSSTRHSQITPKPRDNLTNTFD
ncbi:MAG: hypothetical protein VX737_05530 [Pseudomonadota bacterium]|nr:hypothetical protein [Pseudomonadota bacterium]